MPGYITVQKCITETVRHHCRAVKGFPLVFCAKVYYFVPILVLITMRNKDGRGSLTKSE